MNCQAISPQKCIFFFFNSFLKGEGWKTSQFCQNGQKVSQFLCILLSLFCTKDEKHHFHSCLKWNFLVPEMIVGIPTFLRGLVLFVLRLFMRLNVFPPARSNSNCLSRTFSCARDPPWLPHISHVALHWRMWPQWLDSAALGGHKSAGFEF